VGDAFVTFDDDPSAPGTTRRDHDREPPGQGPGRRYGDPEPRSHDPRGANTLLVSPKGVEVADGLGRVLVAENGAAAPSILVFSAAPTATATRGVGHRAHWCRPGTLDYDPASDTLFIAQTDGSIAVYDAFFSLALPPAPDRVITISDAGVVPVQESVNLHGIVYDAVERRPES
jgi:hypothetical protein